MFSISNQPCYSPDSTSPLPTDGAIAQQAKYRNTIVGPSLLFDETTVSEIGVATARALRPQQRSLIFNYVIRGCIVQEELKPGA